MKKILLPLTLAAALQAHHGVASLGNAGLEGPGAPLETSSSATLPKDSVLLYYKLDHSEYERGLIKGEPEGKYNTYNMYGIGYGFTSWLSAYLFLPYHAKIDETNSGTAGFADMSLMVTLGFTADGLLPETESLDDMEEWHYAVYGGMTLPTGNYKLKDGNGQPIDPGSQLGFGKSAYTLGLAATKQLSPEFTAVFDLSAIRFQENDFSGTKVKYGDENRLNVAAVYKLHTNAATKFRLDGDLELNYLGLGRDEVDGVGEDATGGDILYGVVGARLYKDSSSVGLGVKLPVMTNLNEAEDQHGAEGKESYRIIFTLSTLF